MAGDVGIDEGRIVERPDRSTGGRVVPAGRGRDVCPRLERCDPGPMGPGHGRDGDDAEREQDRGGWVHDDRGSMRRGDFDPLRMPERVVTSSGARVVPVVLSTPLAGRGPSHRHMQ